MQQLRFHVEMADVATLRVINVNMSTLDPAHRALILKHLDDGNDVWHHEWSRTVGGERTEHSQIQRASHRIVAKEASLPSLIEALEKNEHDLPLTPSRKATYV